MRIALQDISMEQLVNPQPLMDVVRAMLHYGPFVYPTLRKHVGWMVIPMFNFPSSSVIQHLASWLHEHGDDHLFVYDLEVRKGYRLDLQMDELLRWYPKYGAFETAFFDADVNWFLYNYYSDFFLVAGPPEILALFSEGQSIESMFAQYIHDVKDTHEGQYKDCHLSICLPLEYDNAEAVPGEWVSLNYNF